MKKIHRGGYFLCLLVICAHQAGYSQSVPVLWDSLYKAQSERNEQVLLAFTANEHAGLRTSAWRALANTTVKQLDTLLYRVLADRTDQAWFALSNQELNQRQLRMLEQVWAMQPNARSGVGLVLGERGDARTREFLSARKQQVYNTDAEFNTALALSRLHLRTGIDSTLHKTIINRVLNVDEPRIRLAWLYAYYRGRDLVLPPDEAAKLFTIFDEQFEPMYRLLRQYIIHITAKSGDTKLFTYLTPDYLKTCHPLDGVEVVRALARFDYGPGTEEKIITLLGHDNSLVVMEVLQYLKTLDEFPAGLIEPVKRLLGDEAGTPEPVYLLALETLATVHPDLAITYLPVDDRNFPGNPALTLELMNVYSRIYSREVLYQKMMNRFDFESPFAAMGVLNKLSASPPDMENELDREAVRAILRLGLNHLDDRVAWSSLQMARGYDLLSESDLAEFQDDITLLDSLNLNRPSGLLIADRELLNQLGKEPIWVIQTDYGNIRVRLHPDKAPATVTAIAALTFSGAYSGGNFHRVVSNFVIQGGMIWQGEGLGGPGFTVPTEATEEQFGRGMLGVASSGRDTEGSQFFIMHMWHPHLNGRYTIFGTVIEGLEVLDKIYRGARIIGAEFENGEG